MTVEKAEESGFFQLVSETASLLHRKIDDFQNPAATLVDSGDSFGDKCHTLNLMHFETIKGIIHNESSLREAKSKEEQEHLLHIRQVLRTMNDAFAWIALGEHAAFMVRRLWRNRPRGFLQDQNPKSALRLIRGAFESNAGLAIWNDSTRCVDLDDMTIRTKEGLTFIELKEGEVNWELGQMVDNGLSSPVLDNLLNTRGPKAIEQLERIIRQRQFSSQLHGFTTTDNAVDPFTGRQHRTQECFIPSCAYDQKLAEHLARAREVGIATGDVDGILRYLVVRPEILRDSGQAPAEVLREWANDVIPPPKPEEGDSRKAIFSFSPGWESPTTMPAFLRNLPGDEIARLAIRSTQLFFCVDFAAFGLLMKNHRLGWSSRKEARKQSSKPKEERCLVVDERIPQLVDQDGNSLSLGDVLIIRMIFEGMRPSDLAAAYDRPTQLPS